MESKLKFRDELKSYVKKVLDVDLDRLPPTRQSKAMTRFYVERVRRIFSPGLVPTEPEDFDACLIDGADDCGVDFISRGDGEVLIIQAKYRGYGVNEKLGDITEFCEVLGRIHPDIGKKYKKNYKLMEAVGDIDWDNDTFQLVFISLGRLGPNLRTKEEEGPTLGPALMDLRDRCELTLCEESDLNVELREAISAGEMITEPVSVTFLPNEEGSPWLKFETNKRAIYLGYVSGSEIAEIFRPRTRRYRLFALNIRDWVGETGTNKGIVKTTEDRPDDFVFFNNGVSAVATSVDEDPEEAKLTCRNFSIINGAQTVRSLFRAQSKSPSAVKHATVMFRISTFSLGKEPTFLEEVTRYNNTQNKISISDFRSNDPVQRDLANKFAELTRGGLHFWYKNKRSREKRDRVPIEMEEFAKTIHAFLYGPHDMWGGTARLFDSSRDGRYVHVFGDGETSWTAVPDEQFRLLSGIWFTCEYVRELWKQEREKRTKDELAGQALERRYIVYYAVAELLRMTYELTSADLTKDLQELWRPKWTERDGHEKVVLRDLTRLAFTGLVKAYETESQKKDFRHRNWFREKESLARIRSELRFILEIKGSGSQPLPVLIARP